MRLHLTQEVENNLHIGFADGVLLNLTCLIERQVQEVNTLQGDTAVHRSDTSLATTNQALDLQDITGVEILGLLLVDEVDELFITGVDNLVLTLLEELVEALGEVHETEHLFVADSDVTTGLISHVNLVFLLHQTLEGTTHGDDIIVGVRREDNHTLLGGFRTLRTVAVVSIGFSTGPSGDGVLQVVEDLDIHVVSRTINSQELAKTILVVILVGEFEDGFACVLAEPYDSGTDEFVVPVAGSHQPRATDAGEVSSSAEIQNHLHIVMHLQEGSALCISHLAFDSALDDISFLIAPSHQEDLASQTNGADTHGDGADGNVLLGAEHLQSLSASTGIQQHETCVAITLGACDIQSDITHTADAEEGDVDTAKLLNHLLISQAMLGYTLLRDSTVKRIDVLSRNIHAVEELILQCLQITLNAVNRKGIELMCHESNYVLETETFLFVHSDKLVEHLCQCSTAGEGYGASTNLTLTLTNGSSNFQSYLNCALFTGSVDIGRQFLKTGEHRTLNRAVRTIVTGRHTV